MSKRIKIENELLSIVIQTKGAELDSIFHKQHQLEYLWQGDTSFWGKKSPILFPIVGTLKDNSFFYEGKKYTLPRHGFARDMIFELEHHTADKATFMLKSDASTFKNYPFHFVFRLHYTLKDNTLSVTYDVMNPSVEKLYFSVGGHPAFSVPLTNCTNYEDYYIELDSVETVGRYPLSNEGLLETYTNDFLKNTNRFALKPELFYADAVVLKELKSKNMAILSDKTPHGLRMNFDGFPFFGIWAAKNAPFVCLEPWCGVADSVDTTQQLVAKEGIYALEGQERFERTWAVSLM